MTSNQSSLEDQNHKQRSGLVGTRHWLTRQVAVLPEEEMQAFDAFVNEMAQSFDPETPVEMQLAQSWATFQWRINRAAALEDTMFTFGNMEGIAENLNIENPQIHNATSNAKTFCSESADFARLSMYSQRLVNQAEKVVKQLLHLQALRKQRQQNELGEATAIYKLHKMQGLPFDPSSRGFTVTVDQIKASIERRITLTHAAQAEEVNWNLPAFVKQFGHAAAA